MAPETDEKAGADAASWEIRPPRQRRSREAWNRILDAGVALFEEVGYEGLTIAAVCDRAGVAPRAIYDRAANKEALFLAVYEHGMLRVRRDNARFVADEPWRDLAPAELIDEAVRALAAVFRRHAPFLRAVIAISGVHPEIYRRGEANNREIGKDFTHVLLRARDQVEQEDPEAAAAMTFAVVFSALVVRTMNGPGFLAPPQSEEEFVSGLSEMARRFLIGAA